MKTWIEHQWGSIEKYYHISSLQLAQVDPGEEDLALTLGFLNSDDNKDYWFNSRSTRLPLGKNVRSFSSDLIVPTICLNHKDVPLADVKTIYKECLNAKGFTAYDGDDNFLPGDIGILYRMADQLVAFSKLRMYKKGAILLGFYSKVDRLGMTTLRFEMNWLKSQGFEYAYLGQGYGLTSIWKAEQSKFEWWSGSAWSTDKELFKQLCRRDDKVIFNEPAEI